MKLKKKKMGKQLVDSLFASSTTRAREKVEQTTDCMKKVFNKKRKKDNFMDCNRKTLKEVKKEKR